MFLIATAVYSCALHNECANSVCVRLFVCVLSTQIETEMLDDVYVLLE